MRSHILILTLLATFSSTISTSILSTTDVASVLASAEDQSSLTLPHPAFAAIKKLGAGGVNAGNLTARDMTALQDCVTVARAGNAASKAGLGGGTGSAGNIVFVSGKITLHACETAQQQVTLASGGASASDTSVKLLISNVSVLNANTKAAGMSGKRAVEFKA